MRVVVTGGSGFVGSHIVQRLLDGGHTPVIIDNLSSSVNNVPEELCVETHRLTLGVDDCRDILAYAGAIIHAAAYADLRANWGEPASEANRLRLLKDNVAGTVSLLEDMPPTIPIAMLSTASIYGAAKLGDPPVVEWEANPESIQSPYAASKFAAEAYLSAFGHARGHRWYAARLVNVVGAGTSHGVIGDFVRMANAGHIHAKDSGLYPKSWVHADDVADAVIAMACPPGLNDIIPSGIYNVTSRTMVSWWDIVDCMGIRRSDVTFNPVEVGAIGDPRGLTASGEKLAAHGFTCKRLVADGIREALASLGYTRRG